MRVPLTTRDFLERAELVYGDRIGVVDEPDQPAPSLGELSYREVARRGRAVQAGLDELGIGEGERVAIVSHNAGRLLELLLSVPSSGRVAVPINFRLSPEEVTYIVGHSGARVLLVDPELESSLKGIEAEHRFGTGEEYEQLLRFDTEPRPWSEPDEEATATALAIWERTNLANLEENILPTRPRATLILKKGADHDVQAVSLRRL